MSRLRHLPAHVLTAMRLPLAALLWIAPENPRFFLAVLAAGALSDVFDGIMARLLDEDMRGDPEHIGAWLDPVCDKVFALSCITAAYAAYHPPLFVVALLLTRELLQLPLLIWYLVVWLPHGRRADFSAVAAGKLTTVLQFGALLCIVTTSPALPWVALAVALSGAVAVVMFVKRAYAHAPSLGHGAA